MAARAGQLFVGTSGYVYPHWRRRFYPPSVPAREWLPFYARRFGTVELNNPFYRLPSAAAFGAWRDAVPAGFVFAVKASRFLTHMKRLKDPAGPLRLLLGRARVLGRRLGPILFQLPGNLPLDLPRLDGFLAALRRQRLVQPLRPVLEVRHPSWLVGEVTDRLNRAGVALCLADWRDVPVTGPVTTDFVYVRRHGGRAGGSYTTGELAGDAQRIRAWLGEGRDVYVYFNNDARAFAVRNARRLVRFLNAYRPKEDTPMPEKKTLERARRARRAGKAPSTQAGEFVREEIEHVREGKHGARSAKQAIAIGLSKARRAGVPLPPPERGRVSDETRRRAARDSRKGRRARRRPPAAKRSRATLRALRREGRSAASATALARQARRSAGRKSRAA